MPRLLVTAPLLSQHPIASPLFVISFIIIFIVVLHRGRMHHHHVLHLAFAPSISLLHCECHRTSWSQILYACCGVLVAVWVSIAVVRFATWLRDTAAHVTHIEFLRTIHSHRTCGHATSPFSRPDSLAHPPNSCTTAAPTSLSGTSCRNSLALV